MNPTEYQEGKVFHQWLDLKRIPHCHVSNEQPNKLRAYHGRMLGVSAGFPDYIIILPKGKTLFVELKRRKGGRLSDNQSKWIKTFVDNGHQICVANGADEAIEYVNKHIPKKTVEF